MMDEGGRSLFRGVFRWSAVWLSTLIALSAGDRWGHADDPDTLNASLNLQAEAWNRGDLDAFMGAYWKSPKLTFSSGGETTRGWNETLERYRKRYPDRETMGRLKFSELETQMLGSDVALTLGRWELDRKEPARGNFSLVWRKMDGTWRIVHDHSSSSKTP